MNILVSGILGYMGREGVKLCESGCRGAVLHSGVDPNATGKEAAPVYTSFDEASALGVDCIVDFSHHSATPALLDFAVKGGIPVILCTTGHTEAELSLVNEAAASIPIFHSGNMSLGIALLMELAKTVAQHMPEAEVEIIEKHHNRKLDAPSGTALMLAEAVKEARPEAYSKVGRAGQGKREFNEIGIHSVRMGNIVGVHEVIIGTNNQTITLKHEAHDRALFAEGALAAAEFILDCAPGLYDMKSIVSGKSKENAYT